ncbi:MULTISPECIES: FKBP-type peptidyl-prolyl cis-trans isomerase [Gammaproteobacteria]|uniref:FKBP-type peptidyl-prolyl cis-trans isomerase n=1 Tax=Gammaproteobacteria TaxID=1236 RepID=UPI000DD0E8EC|nr:MULTISPECIES: FKBP-type peptidyl-prolyl cis-trans isomerase [Gammaproteobacteria]RTE85710.1 FKBP-type peptidyl-prolyl cis-trans isomerase [Aliidiomarina sp. B3213]TCZ90290.1 FKBP-type peptidyl-prolyl cis-trans isomerase [Lysobacter sp. N42]
MRTMAKAVLASAVALAIVGCGAPSEEETSTQVALETDADRQAYALGTVIGREMKSNMSYLTDAGIELNTEVMMMAIEDAMNDNQQLTDEEVDEQIQALVEISTQRAEEQAAQESESNLVAGQEFAAENAQREGVTVTESGLQYEVITEGSGAQPGPEDVVRVHYAGTLIDGTEFDSSYSRGEPLEFPLNRVIPGWSEGVQLMSEGAKYRFVIPSDLAYGSDARPGSPIPANSTLVFEVELLEVVEAEPATEE